MAGIIPCQLPRFICCVGVVSAAQAGLRLTTFAFRHPNAVAVENFRGGIGLFQDQVPVPFYRAFGQDHERQDRDHPDQRRIQRHRDARDRVRRGSRPVQKDPPQVMTARQGDDAHEHHGDGRHPQVTGLAHLDEQGRADTERQGPQ